ncbi:cell adhesion molecule 1 [Procambarus clarkii]|uniref:cell adhesion molecule 1 n=1 Tax=Procambarus clarkii TaxID=6728 RepID=UPI001E673F0D|nr:uncharacterized protein LOC123767153 [Procambarus clarkii]
MASSGSSNPSPLACCSFCCLYRYLLLLLLLCGLLARPGAALKWVRFNVPPWAAMGGEALLTCQFNLAGDELYSVKWYKAGREFYRYVPAEWPRQQFFPFPGITVDTERSDEQQVALKRVSLETAGRYKCEVLTEAPQFRTLVRSASLTVYDLPDGGPEVVGGQETYRPGETVNLTCQAPKSIPATTLTWFINNEVAPQNYLVEYKDPPDADGREASRLGLQFRAHDHHFPDGRLTLRCVAALHRLYQKDALHEGVVAPPGPLSLGHDANGACERLSLWEHLCVLLSLLIAGLTAHLFQTLT